MTVAQPSWNQAIPHSCLPRAHFAKGCKNTATATLTTFRINTCKSVSKQRTLTLFRINTYKKTGVYPPSLRVQPFRPSNVPTLLFPKACRLFALFRKRPSFVFNRLQPLFAKHPGWGYLRFLQTFRRSDPRLPHPGIGLRDAPTLRLSGARADVQTNRYPFRYLSTASLLRQAPLLATIARTHRIAFSGAAPLSIRQVETGMATINRQEL